MKEKGKCMNKINKEFWAEKLSETIDLNQPISDVSDKPTKLFDPIESAIEEIQHAMKVNECAMYDDALAISGVSSELAIEALRTQMPQKPLNSCCPICKADIETLEASGIVGYNYCPNCGQKLDWSEEE